MYNVHNYKRYAIICTTKDYNTKILIIKYFTRDLV